MSVDAPEKNEYPRATRKNFFFFSKKENFYIGLTIGVEPPFLME